MAAIRAAIRDDWQRSLRHQPRFEAKAVGRTENDVRFSTGPDAKDTLRFIAPAKEQLALITEGNFHICFLSLEVGGVKSFNDATGSCNPADWRRRKMNGARAGLA